jgi:transposase
VGRCLDRLFDADYSSMILALVTHVIQEFEVELTELHNDSTTIRFFGEYEHAFPDASMRGKPTLGITFGHSKDHRPDLKQLLFILTISRDGAVPVYFTAADGNVTDDRTHRQTWDLLCQLAGRRDFLYVADSKLATAENMAHVHQNGGRFISVLPRTRAEDKQFRERVRAGAVRWKDVYTRTDDEGGILDVFQGCEEAQITTEGYRLVWFHSMVKQELDRRARSSQIEAALVELAELQERLRSPRTRFTRRDKVASAVERILEERGASVWIGVTIEQVDEESYRQEQRGRPGKDTRYVKNVRSRFALEYKVNTEALGVEERADGIFPLVTNVRDLDDCEVLLAYKKQPWVEKRFSQIKTDFEVAPVYLKNVGRIEALLCLYFLALLVQALLEREIRSGMSRHRVESLPLYPEGKPCKRPCTRRLLDLFENIYRHELIEKRHEPVVMVTDLAPIQREVLELLGIPIGAYGQPSRN